MDETKTCKRCGKQKYIMMDFYMSKGKYQGVCKACVIQKNCKHQKKTKPWKRRILDPAVKLYHQKYYQEHKDKFKEYAAKFKQENPEYQKMWQRKRRQEK